MFRSTLLAALFGLALATGAALAEDVEGKIRKIDTERGVLVLSDGSEYVIPDEFNIEGLEPGIEVVIFFDMIDGKKTLAGLDILE